MDVNETAGIALPLIVVGSFTIKRRGLRLRLSPEFANIRRLNMAGTIGKMSSIFLGTTLAIFTAVAMIMSLPSVSSEDCGQQAGGALCPGGLCCSKWGWCGKTQAHCGQDCQSQCGGGGSTPTPTPTPSPSGQGIASFMTEDLFNQLLWCGNTQAHCGQDCQSQCGGGGSTPTPTTPTPTPTTPTPSRQGVASIMTEDLFNQLLKYKDDSICEANGFYSHAAFIAAANAFSGFGTAGDLTTNKRELAAFLAQTSHETTGGWQSAPDGPYAWGYCFKEENDPPSDYCKASPQWACASGKSYYGRGPLQISWNYNYGPAGSALGFDGINNPDIVASDPTVSFKTAVWFWMTAQSPKPSCHDVMTGTWSPSGSDSAAGRAAGYGLVTNIINGGLECGKGSNVKQEDRIGFYKRYCDILGVSYGSNIDCNSQTPYGG